jgi:hypothetical protein
MSDGPNDFIASVYRTGMSQEEKTAADETAALEQMEKAAAIEAFTNSVAERGLDVKDYTDEQIATAFGQFVDGFTKEAAEVQTPEQAEEIVKQAWAEADQWGRMAAQQEFLKVIKEAAEKPAPEAPAETAGTEAAPAAAAPAPEAAAPAAEKSASLEGLGDIARYLQAPQPAEQAKEAAETPPPAQPEQQAQASPTPFLDAAITKCAMAYGISSGAITPDGKLNLNEKGELLTEPTWTAEMEMAEPKTALDQQIHAAALNHLAELGYPVNKGEEA